MSDHQRTIRRRWRVQTIYMILLFSLGNVAIQIFYILPKRLDHNDHTPYVMVQQQLLLDMIQPHHNFLNNKTTQQQPPIDDLSRHLHLEPNSNVRLLLINHHNVSNTDTENRTTTTTSSTTQNTLPKVKYAYFTLISSPEYIIGRTNFSMSNYDRIHPIYPFLYYWMNHYVFLPGRIDECQRTLPKH